MNFQEEDDDIIRNSRSQMFFKIGVLKNFAVFTGKYLCWSLLYNKVAGLKDSYTGFPMNIVKFSRAPFLTEHLWWMVFYYLIASRSVTYFAPL